MGDNVVWVRSVLCPKGPKYLGELMRRVFAWLDAEGYDSVDETQGSALSKREDGKALFTRLHYAMVLQDATSRYEF